MNYYSQHGEDRWIIENLKPEVGIFCEVGAYDGVKASNTLAFEELGWRGLVIEAVPELAAQCRANRNAITWCCAVGYPSLTGFYINPNDAGAGGLNRPGLGIRMVVRPLWELIEASQCAKIDLLSIDTEGTELDVWENIGLYRPKILIVEYRTFDEPPQDAVMLDRLSRDGYRLVHKTECNLILTR